MEISAREGKGIETWLLLESPFSGYCLQSINAKMEVVYETYGKMQRLKWWVEDAG